MGKRVAINIHDPKYNFAIRIYIWWRSYEKNDIKTFF